MESYIMIGFSIFLGALFVGGAIITSKMLAFHSPEGWRKVQPYECSENPIGDARIRFKVAFYIFALLFLLFDIEKEIPQGGIIPHRGLVPALSSLLLPQQPGRCLHPRPLRSH